MSLGSGDGWITPTQKQIVRKLTPGQTKVLDYVRAEVAAGRPFPKNRQIIEHLGCRPDWVLQVLNSLFDLGFVRQERINPDPKKGVQRIEWALEQGR